MLILLLNGISSLGAWRKAVAPDNLVRGLNHDCLTSKQAYNQLRRRNSRDVIRFGEYPANAPQGVSSARESGVD